jgi:hypothetical protein
MNQHENAFIATVQDWPLWSHNVPHLLTGTVHVNKQSERHLLNKIYSCATPRWDSQIWHQLGFVQCHQTWFTVQYMMILAPSSLTSLMQMLENSMPHYVHLFSCSNDTHSFSVPPTHFSKFPVQKINTSLSKEHAFPPLVYITITETTMMFTFSEYILSMVHWMKAEQHKILLHTPIPRINNLP